LVLLGVRCSFKADLQASAELVYGEPLRIPGEFLTQIAHPDEPAQPITQLRQHMARLRPSPHASPGTFVHKDLHNCTRLPPSGRNAQGSGAPLQRPLPSPVKARNNATIPRARQAHRSVNRQGQACQHIQRGRLQEHRLQPCGQTNASHSTTGYTTSHIITAYSYPNYEFHFPPRFNT
jgi:hypothetical protein